MAEELKLAVVFGSNMVLQRGGPVRVWGAGTPGETVEALLAGRRGETVVGANGRWCLEMPEVGVGGPYQLSVRSGDEERCLSNVLVGDVWLCSGQSNMELTTASLGPEYAPFPARAHPAIRLFTVPRTDSATPQDDLTRGVWETASPEAIESFSAVGFFFGRELEKALNVPIGLINSSWGGTTAESWTPIEALTNEPSLAHLARTEDAPVPKPHIDSGNEGFTNGWAKRDADESLWRAIPLPGLWQSAGMPHNGAVWFRKRVRVPAAWAGHALTLNLGPIDDFDVTYFNGHEVGAIGPETVGWWAIDRRYTVPERFVREGDNIIAIRVFDQWGNGGFIGPEPKMSLAPAGAPHEAIYLAGDWMCRVERALPIRDIPGSVGPTVLYNGMIHPLVGLRLKGVIWYQGESNAVRARQYETLLTTLIRAWRQRWGIGDFPFLIVQLANYGQFDNAGASPWAELRESQHRVAIHETNCGIACAIDIGDPRDVHPRNKPDVGKRLAHEALRVAYQRTDAPRSPAYRDHTIAGARMTIRFDHAASGLISNGPARGFCIAGEDRVFHPADAVLDGDKVIVSSPQVAAPVAVRYAWRGDPESNLRGINGLPALPFRTDDWPGVTDDVR